MAPQYTATYAFNGYPRGDYAEAVSRISETIAELNGEGIDLEFLGATQEIDGDGQLIAVTARYEAPSKGAVGRLGYRACLPGTGSPRLERQRGVESGERRVAAAGRS